MIMSFSLIQSRTPALIFEHIDNTDFKVRIHVHVQCRFDNLLALYMQSLLTELDCPLSVFSSSV